MITPAQGADIITYLSDAGALSIGSDAQGAVWADILNDPRHGVPGLTAMDLRPACREALHRWASDGRSWKVDAPRFAKAVKAVWGRRRSAYRQLHAGTPGHALDGSPMPEGDMTGAEYATWLQAANAAVREGVEDAEEVQARAYYAIGREIPALQAPTERREPPALTLKGIPE